MPCNPYLVSCLGSRGWFLCKSLAPAFTQSRSNKWGSLICPSQNVTEGSRVQQSCALSYSRRETRWGHWASLPRPQLVARSRFPARRRQVFRYWPEHWSHRGRPEKWCWHRNLLPEVHLLCGPSVVGQVVFPMSALEVKYIPPVSPEWLLFASIVLFLPDNS